MKLTISQEGSSPITISVPDNKKVKTVENDFSYAPIPEDYLKEVSLESNSIIDNIFEDVTTKLSVESIGSAVIKKFKRSKNVQIKNVAEYWKNEELKNICTYLKNNLNTLKKDTKVITLSIARSNRCKLFHRSPKDMDVNGIKVKNTEKVIDGVNVILTECTVDNAHVATSQIWFMDKSNKCYGVVVHPNICIDDMNK